eukprot:4410989-Prymnesium_polylepis.1
MSPPPRSRCCFEGAVSNELTARIRAFPKMCAILDTLPPKVLLLRSGIKAQPVELDATPLDERVQVVLKKIQNATFTSKKDNHKVLDMYKQYVTRT